MAKNLILMMGIPGVGKSTLLKEKCNPKTDIIVSRDAIRFNILKDTDDYFSNEQAVWQEYIMTLQLFLTDDRWENVIADATHLNPRTRDKVLDALDKILKKEGIDVYVLWVNASLETALNQNSQRKGRALVPESAIKNMYKSLQPPIERENFYFWGYLGSPINLIFKKGVNNNEQDFSQLRFTF